MFVRIFKILTSLLVVGALFSLISKRELILSMGKDLYSTRNSSSTTLRVNDPASSTPSSSEEILPIETLTTIDLKTSTTTLTTIPSEKNKPAQASILKKPVAKIVIKEVSKSSVYTNLEEGKLDSDPTYRPVTSPCKVTMGYKIGTLDSHFGISKEEFQQKINAASDLWGNQVGKKLFRYDEQGPLTINLIYDERQVRTENVNNLALEIDNAKESAEAIRSTYEKEKVVYLAFGNQLTKDAEAFQAKYKIYADKIETYNTNGGAPKDEYEKMMVELTSLKEEAATLEKRRTELLSQEESINKKVTKYNEFVIYINDIIKKSNTLGAKKFTEGRFSPNKNTIDIYQYNDTIKLQRVIAHELGHALGINHNNNIRSIMYSVNSATTTVLSNEDVKDLQLACSL